jgi:tetratricopeptide (TPR) repeat protein
MKNWWIGVVAVLVLGAIMFMSDRKLENPSGRELIRNQDEYVNSNNRAFRLCYDIFQREISGGAITESDKDKVREALKDFEAMRLYNRTHVQSDFGAGMCYLILGEKEKASECFQQAIENKTKDNDANKIAMELTVYESAAQLSKVTLDLAAQEIGNFNSLSQANDKAGAEAAKQRSLNYYNKALEAANIAVTGKPDSAAYLVDRANVYLALKKDDLAKEDVAKAKVLNPQDPTVKMAAKMLGL